MKYEVEEEVIIEALKTIHTPEYDIFENVKKEIDTSRTSFNVKKSLSTALAACLCILISISVAAAIIPSFNNLLYFVSPEIALVLQQVSHTSEDKGIRMEVVAAMNDHEMAVIYVTMQDLIENRIDETLDLYNFSLTGGQMFNSQIVNFDKETGIATLLIQINGGEALDGKVLSFKIDSFLSQKQIFEALETGINLLEIRKEENPQTMPLNMNNISGGGGDFYEDFKAKGTIEILKTDKKNITIPNIDFMHISNIGYIDNYLHIQTKWTRDGVDDHGYVYFVDALGQQIEVKGTNLYFGIDQKGNATYGGEYVEYIYDLNEINIEEVNLLAYLVSGNYTTGKWKTTFKIQSVIGEKEIKQEIDLDTWIVNKVTLSPMGLTLVGKGENNNFKEISIIVNMIDGQIQRFDSVRSFREDSTIRLKYTSSMPLDMSKVESVNINGKIIKFD